MPIVYCSEDDGTLYPESAVDFDPTTKVAFNYVRYEISETITLTAKQICGGYGDIANILVREGILKKTVEGN